MNIWNKLMTIETLLTKTTTNSVINSVLFPKPDYYKTNMGLRM